MNPWDKDYQEGHYRQWPNETLVSWVCQKFPTGSGLRALDLGCGAGANAWFLWEHGFETVAVDSSTEGIVAANRLRQKRNGNWAISQRDVVDDGLYSLGGFDLICDVTCLQHLTEEDHAKALAEIYRRLRPGGWLFSYRLGYGTDYEVIFPNQPPVWLPTTTQLRVNFHNAGWKGPWSCLPNVRAYPGWEESKCGFVVHYFLVEAQKEKAVQPCEQPSSLERSSLLFW